MIDLNKKPTLFNYLYDSLRDLIITGRLPYGSKMPSISEICLLYNIGIRTVKDVLKKLKEDGYIKTHERKASIVIYQPDQLNNQRQGIYFLQHRNEMIEVYKTINIVLPLFISFAVDVLTDDDLYKWINLLKQSQNKNILIREKIFSHMLYDILEKSYNPFLRSIFSSLEIYAQPIYFLNYEANIQYIQLEKKFKNIDWVVESFITKDKVEIDYRFHLMFETVIQGIDKVLNSLTSQYPDILESKPQFHWFAQLGRNHYYTSIARDIIDKICLGIYPEESFLPAEAKLAQSYCVSVSTIRKSLRMINELGFGQTMNVKGTKVFIQNNHDAIKCLKNKQYRQDTLLYLNAMQVMIILIEKAALLAFPYIDNQDIQQLQNEMTNPNKFFLESLLDCILAHLPLLPLQQIIQEINQIIYWGYYFSFYPTEKRNINIVTIKSHNAFDYLCDHNAILFAKEISSSYKHALNVVRDYLIDFGLTEAKHIITPN